MLTDTNGIIEYVNPAVEALTGYDRSEIVGRTPATLKSGVHDEAFYDNLWSTITSGKRWEGEIVNQRKDGSRYHIQQTIAPIFDPSGETVERFVAVNQDITDHVEHERELRRQNERLEEYGQTVAHDLRNPLSVIEGRLELAKHSEDPDDHIDHAIENAARMRVLIEDLLSLAKYGTRVMETEPEALDSLASAAWSQVQTPDATLTIADSARFEVDESRTRELLENLFRNAVEHAGDDVDLEVGVTSSGTGFYVADDGPGIPPSDCDRIFDSGYTTSEAGTGFGLAIVKSIVDSHGWGIDVTSHHTGGARIEITGATRAT